MSGFEVGVSALAAPTQRLKQISSDLWTAGSGAATAAGNGGGAAGNPAVVSAAAVFEAGVGSVLRALGDDADLLGSKVQRAGVTYEAVDRTALPTGGAPGGPAPGGGRPAGPPPDGPPGGPAPGGAPPGGPAPAAFAPGGSAPGDPASGGSASGSPAGGSAPADSPAASPPAPATVQVASGDSLWSIAERSLGPGVSTAAVAAEVHRWHDANRAAIGPDPDRLPAGIPLQAPGGPAGSTP